MLAATLVGLALAAAPQDGSGARVQNPAESTVDDIVVLGRSVEQQARDYVTTLTAAPGRSRLARWRRTVCVGVTGLDAGYAHYLIDRISAVAASVGLNPGDPGCRPDVLIAVTRDPDAVAQAWVADDPNLFRPSRNGGTDLGAEALERFTQSDVPIRWWHVSLTVNAQSGQSVTQTRDGGATVNYVNTPSLIQSSTREQLVRVFIVVDADRIGQTSFGSLSDYLAFVVLTQTDPEAETTGFDTILNLFSGQPAARLSAWDSDYLQSLYRTGVNPIRASTQERRIARVLAGRRAPDAAPTPTFSPGD